MRAKAKSRVFALWVYPVGATGYGLRLCQASESGNDSLQSGAKIEQIQDDPLKLTLADVIASLKHMGHKPSELQRGKTSPFRLPIMMEITSLTPRHSTVSKATDAWHSAMPNR